MCGTVVRNLVAVLLAITATTGGALTTERGQIVATSIHAQLVLAIAAPTVPSTDRELSPIQDGLSNTNPRKRYARVTLPATESSMRIAGGRVVGAKPQSTRIGEGLVNYEVCSVTIHVILINFHSC